jgi:hypothetical protein
MTAENFKVPSAEPQGASLTRGSWARASLDPIPLSLAMVGPEQVKRQELRV